MKSIEIYSNIQTLKTRVDSYGFLLWLVKDRVLTKSGNNGRSCKLLCSLPHYIIKWTSWFKYIIKLNNGDEKNSSDTLNHQVRASQFRRAAVIRCRWCERKWISFRFISYIHTKMNILSHQRYRIKTERQ
jgi:hypothetical protein